MQEGIGTLVIGKNDGWKQRVHMGKRNNQMFVFLPHARFIEMLTYKAELVGIEVVLTEESYTSKASFLDGDLLPIYGATDGATNPASNGAHAAHVLTPVFSGKQVQRGWYRTASGRQINADVNGSYNILRKVFPDACSQVFAQDVAQVKIHPIRLVLRDRHQDRRKQSRTPRVRATG